MRDKIAGVIYGMAIGDAMGMPSELWSRQRVSSYFGRITTFLDGPKENEVACEYKLGQYTDDTAQALVILDSLFETEYEVDPSNIAAHLLKWAEAEKAFEKNILGPSSKEALLCFKQNQEATKVTAKAQTNGAAMRISPIGCLFHASDKEALVQYVYEISKVTHSSDVTIAGAAMIAMAISSAMEHDDFDRILQDIYEVETKSLKLGVETFNPSLVARTKLGITLAQKYKNRDDEFLENIYQIIGAGVLMSESVPAAIAIAYYAQDVKTCSLLCANLGGDTDTIGAMATAICGALKGYASIDPDYIATISQANEVDFEHYINELCARRGSV
ncbi:MAG: ADP-ribosylglycohydrolase family protein [Turicibacter sp.]